MTEEIELEILPSGRIKFKRGDKGHNDKMKQIISSIVDDDEEVMKQVEEFFSGSEDVELLVGDTIFCG